MITVQIHVGENQTADTKQFYPSMNTGSPTTYWYWRYLDSGYRAPSDVGSFKYEPTQTTYTKVPFKGLKYPLTPKPYFVASEVINRKHGYVRREVTQTSRDVISHRVEGTKTTEPRLVVTNEKRHWDETRLSPLDLQSHVELALPQFYLEIDERVAQLRSEVAARLYKKAEGDWDLLTELAELNDTMSTLAGALSALTSSAPWKKLAKQARKRPGKTVSKGILQAQYGFAPIFYSVGDIQKCIERWQKKRFQTMESDTIRYENGLIKAECEIRVTGHVKVMSAFGRLTINPLQTVWEKLPYSFVVDWVSNLGDLISAWGTVINPFVITNGDVGVRLKTKISAASSEASSSVSITPGQVYTGKGWVTYDRIKVVTTSQPSTITIERNSFKRDLLSPEIINPFISFDLTARQGVLGAALLFANRK